MANKDRSTFLARAFRSTVVFCIASFLVSCGTPYGIYHKVESGQTLYRIAATYRVPVDKLLEVNRIRDETKIRSGQLVFIPGVSRPRMVPVIADPGPVKDKRKQRSSKSRKPAIESRPPRIILSARKAPIGLALKWPVVGQVSSPFGKLPDRNHDGVDIVAPQGTPIKAAASGRVIYAGDGIRGYGNLIIIKHDDGVSTVYAHNQKNILKKGEFVSAGETIGTVGNTGRASGYHLHFEVRIGKKPVNPLQYLPQN